MPDDHLKISLVVPNYNSGDQLARALASVVAQGYPNLELNPRRRRQHRREPGRDRPLPLPLRRDPHRAGRRPSRRSQPRLPPRDRRRPRVALRRRRTAPRHPPPRRRPAPPKPGRRRRHRRLRTPLRRRHNLRRPRPRRPVGHDRRPERDRAAEHLLASRPPPPRRRTRHVVRPRLRLGFVESLPTCRRPHPRHRPLAEPVLLPARPTRAATAAAATRPSRSGSSAGTARCSAASPTSSGVLYRHFDLHGCYDNPPTCGLLRSHAFIWTLALLRAAIGKRRLYAYNWHFCLVPGTRAEVVVTIAPLRVSLRCMRRPSGRVRHRRI